MGKIVRYTATTTNVGAVAYTAGDEISNSATAGSVVRPSFDLSGFSRGRVLSLSADVTPASGNVVITAFNIEASLYKSADAPAAVGDNVALPISGATRRKSCGHFLFDDGGWKNPLGAFTASTSAYQESPASMAVPIATPTIASPWPPGHIFTFDQGETPTLVLVLQALAAWTPVNVVNTFGLVLELEVE